MRKLSVLFWDIVKDAQGRNWFFDNKNRFIGYTYDDFKQVFPVRKLSEDVEECAFKSYNIYLCEDIIYIASFYSVDVLGYDMKKNIFVKYCACQGDKDIYFTLFVDKKIIYFPRTIGNRIYVFDVESKSFCDNIWMADKLVQSGQLSYVYKKENTAYMVVEGTNTVICLNVIDFSLELMTFKADICLYSMLVDNDGAMWLTQYDSQEIIYYNNGHYRYYNADLQNDNIEKPFWALLKYGNRVVVLANRAKYVVVLNETTGDVKRIDSQKEGERVAFRGFHRNESRVFLFPWSMDALGEFDIEEEVFFWHSQEVSLKDYYNILVNKYVCETDETDIEEFCEFVTAADISANNDVLDAVGHGIYECIRD